MSRYFIELSYKGTAYAGYQVQQNANTVQAEVEKALGIFYRDSFSLTGSSRTDAGVHALQNFFHVDVADWSGKDLQKDIYHLNAILPPDIVIHRIFSVAESAHCRFDALSRSYIYTIYQSKDPFLADRAWFYPYMLDLGLLNEAAAMLLNHTDFESFAKRNSQVFTYQCNILHSEWSKDAGKLLYKVTANRFLRGMVRGLVGTMLRVGRGKTTLDQFQVILAAKNPAMVDFSTPAQGLMLAEVSF